MGSHTKTILLIDQVWYSEKLKTPSSLAQVIPSDVALLTVEHHNWLLERFLLQFYLHFFYIFLSCCHHFATQQKLYTNIYKKINLIKSSYNYTTYQWFLVKTIVRYVPPKLPVAYEYRANSCVIVVLVRRYYLILPQL